MVSGWVFRGFGLFGLARLPMGFGSIDSMIPNLPAAKRIGELYLSQTGVRRTRDDYEAELFNGLSETERLLLLSNRGRFRDFIARKSRADFLGERVHCLDGTYLSHTELQLCCLAVTSSAAG